MKKSASIALALFLCVLSAEAFPHLNLPTSAGGSQTAASPEINVKGNNVSIADGDATPSLEDDTDFGSLKRSEGTVTHTFTIENTGTATLNLSGVHVKWLGDSFFSLSFTNSSFVIAPGGSTSFDVIFDPAGVGLRSAEIIINSDDADEGSYNFFIQGVSVGASVSGSVIDSSGNALAGAQVTVTDFVYVGTATTDAFGFFTVSDVPIGAPYLVSVAAKGYTFKVSSQVVQVGDDVTGVNFVGGFSTTRRRGR